MSEQFIFVDRYSAAGIPYPKAETVCLGHCEGVGCFPVNSPIIKATDKICEVDRDNSFDDLWLKEHERHCNFVGILRDLWEHKELWYWKSIWRDIYNWLNGGDFCDGWHFVKCPDCNGTGKRC